MTDSTMLTQLVTVTGTDRPGLSAQIFAALDDHDVVVLDIEQQVLRGHMTLAILVVPPDAGDVEIERRLAGPAERYGLHVNVTSGYGDNSARPGPRLRVIAVGAPLRVDDVVGVTTCIAAEGGNIDRIRRLSRDPVTTIEFDVSGGRLDSLRRALSRVAVARHIDIAVAPSGLASHGRLLVVLDVDSTFIQNEVIDLLALHARRSTEVARITEQAMRGEIDFTESLRRRVELLAGLDVGVFDEVRRAVRLTPGARTLVRTLRTLGHSVALVSGGFIEIVAPLADDLGIEHVQANHLEVVDGKLTGRLIGAVVDRQAKADALRRFAAMEDIPLSRTVAVGDGANDLDMLDAAALGVAFNAKPVVRRQADTSVTVPYLDTVLYLIGVGADVVDRLAADGD